MPNNGNCKLSIADCKQMHKSLYYIIFAAITYQALETSLIYVKETKLNRPLIRSHSVRWMLLLVICVAFGTQSVHATPKADSLKQVLAGYKKEDTAKIRLLLNLGEAYYGLRDDSMQYYGRQGLALAKKLNSRMGEVNALGVIGSSYFMNNRLDSARYGGLL